MAGGNQYLSARTNKFNLYKISCQQIIKSVKEISKD